MKTHRTNQVLGKVQGALFFCLLLLVGGVASSFAAEWHLDLLTQPVGQTPKGFRPALTGTGAPPRWKIILDRSSSPFRPLTPGASAVWEPVIAQLSTDPTDERFPLLIYTNQVFRDFQAEVRFKLIGGQREQMAGLAFRLKDPQNYYVVRASRLGKTFRFYKVQNGRRTPPIGPTDVVLKTNHWYTLRVECEGNRIRLFLDGKQQIPNLTDYSYREGYLALWTKSDSIVYFKDLHVSYTPIIPPIQEAVRQVLKRHSRLLDLQVFAPETKGATNLVVVAAKNPEDLGKPGGKVEWDVIHRNIPYAGKGKRRMIVTLPLHDRNGDPIAAVRLVMRTFFGQTTQNAVMQATSIVKEIEKEIVMVDDPFH